MVPNTLLLMLFEYLEAKGIDAATFLKRPRPDLTTEELIGVPILEWAEMLYASAALLKDENFGLSLGSFAKPKHTGIMSYLTFSSENLGQALLEFNKYQRLLYDVTPMTIRAHGPHIELVWNGHMWRPGQIVDECSLATLIQTCRNICGESMCPTKVCFIYEKPEDTSPYEEYFGCPVHFSCSETVIQTDLETLSKPISSSNKLMLKSLEAIADKMIIELPSAPKTATEMRKIIVKKLRIQNLSIEQVAAEIGVSERTLQRHLKELNSSFKNEVGEIRHNMAKKCLLETNLDESEISQMIGINDPNKFIDKFERKEGMTPHRYRLQNQK
tara:strand:- start:4829 stop:5815 length:987 start_codon:yes stop_codon:yes gene_type:complete